MDVEALLASRFQSAAAADLDVTIRLAVDGGGTLATFAVADGELWFDPDSPADATFAFASADAALAILVGDEDPMAAFMAGHFRADGHLPLAFALLGLFRPGYGVGVPP